jgi:hypothetical protein
MTKTQVTGRRMPCLAMIRPIAAGPAARAQLIRQY